MPVWEVCVAARDFGPGRAQEGDVIAARVPTGAIGTKEGKDFFWLTIDTDLSREELMEPGSGSGPGGKRKHKLDLVAFTAEEGLDKARINDPNDEYQPCLGLEHQPGKFKHIQVKGLSP